MAEAFHAVGQGAAAVAMVNASADMLSGASIRKFNICSPNESS
jgi:hypothetical protein